MMIYFRKVRKVRTKNNPMIYFRKVRTKNNPCPHDYDEIVTLVSESCDKLPGELVVEILCKLPVKSLLRFRTVCKPWKLLINSPVFIDNHLHRKNPQYGWYSVYPKEYTSRENPPFQIKYLVGACNGLICLETYSKEKPLLLINPSTREFSFLPPEFDTPDFYGFCYLPKTKEYQIISFDQHRHDNNINLSILTLGSTKSLRHVKDVFAPGEIDTDQGPTNCGTSMFWMGDDYAEPENEIVICYEAIQERFSKIDVPPSPCPMKLNRTLGVLDDSVIMFVYHDIATFFDIWILVDDNSWMKYRRVESLKFGTNIYPINVCQYDRLILCSKVQLEEGYENFDLFYFDLEMDQIQDYKLTDAPIDEFVNYVESLVSINSLVPSKACKKDLSSFKKNRNKKIKAIKNAYLKERANGGVSRTNKYYF